MMPNVLCRHPPTHAPPLGARSRQPPMLIVCSPSLVEQPANSQCAQQPLGKNCASSAERVASPVDQAVCMLSSIGGQDEEGDISSSRLIYRPTDGVGAACWRRLAASHVPLSGRRRHTSSGYGRALTDAATGAGMRVAKRGEEA